MHTKVTVGSGRDVVCVRPLVVRRRQSARRRHPSGCYPLTRGPGPRLFPEDVAPSKLSLAACEWYENGVVYLAYRPWA